jgi:hypothetical protein
MGIKAFFAFLGLFALCAPGLGDVVINEFELSPPDNSTVWVELYNTGDQAVNLTNWTVTIVDTPWQGLIPLTGSIDAKGFVAFDGQDTWITTGNGTIFLYNDKDVEMDKTPQQSDMSHTDFTYGRLPDGHKTDTRADFAFMMASKGRSNSAGGVKA